MGLQFDNPIVAGDVLVRPAIRSPNYIPGVSGWTINQDGTFEFGETGVIRGEVIVRSPSGSEASILANATVAAIVLMPADVVGVDYDPATIFAITYPAQDNAPALALVSPAIDLPPTQSSSRIDLVGEDDAGNPPSIDMRTPGGSVRIYDSITDEVGRRYAKTALDYAVPVPVAAATTAALAVVFPTPFDSVPVVATNIAGTAGGYARWGSRAVSVTNTGFTIFVFAVNPSGTTYTGDVPVDWSAIALG